MNVYIVTEGEYSAYRIRAVFSRRPKAVAYKKLLREATVETWPIDIPPTAWVQTVVHMARDGTVEEARQVVSNEDWVQANGLHKCGNGHMMVSVRTEDVERAIKVANEKRVQFIASGEWP